MLNTKRALLAVVACLLLAGCTGAGGNDAFNRRRADLFGRSTPAAQTATALPAPTARPTASPAPAQQTAGDVQAVVNIDHDGDSRSQFLIVGLLIALGIPAFWVIALSRKGARS